MKIARAMETCVKPWLFGPAFMYPRPSSTLLFSDRHVPEQMWYTHPAFAIALGGVLPFGAVCIELFFIMSALWLHQVGNWQGAKKKMALFYIVDLLQNHSNKTPFQIS